MSEDVRTEQTAAPAPRELILLSPYRLPAQNSSYLGSEDMVCFLTAFTALWHPAAVRGASGPPRIASPYDHETPTAGHVYAVPESPPLVLPDDWEQRVREAGAVFFRATPDRETTLRNLEEALRAIPHESDATHALLNLDAETVGAFFGLGFGFGMLEALFEAMEHENLIATADFWQDVQKSIACLLDPNAEPPTPEPPSPVEPPPTEEPSYNYDAPPYEPSSSPPPAPEGPPWRRRLHAAAERLLSAREILYSVTIHIVDLFLLDETRLAGPWPAAWEQGLPINILATGEVLEKLAREQPERAAQLRERIAAGTAEVVGGLQLEREDALLPVESQLWNLIRGMETSKQALGEEVRVHGRRRFAAHPQTPLFLNAVGINRTLLLALDEAVLPSHRATVVNWPSPEGKQVEAFARAPSAAGEVTAFFHVAHNLHRTIMQDHAATQALLHTGSTPSPWYDDWVRLTRLTPLLGRWTTLTSYFNEVMAGEYASAGQADEFHGDYLGDRCTAGSDQPVSWFAAHLRARRRLDTVWSLAAIHRSLAGAGDPLGLETSLASLEQRVETARTAFADDSDLSHELDAVQQKVSEALARMLQTRAADRTPGLMVLNPCSFARRVVVEAVGVQGSIPIEGPVKACQLEGESAKLVVEVPALGFAWVPRSGPAVPPSPARMKLADERCVRNEFFEAEVDPQTGGLRAIRDHRTRMNRLGQQMVYNPGSTAKVTSVKVTSTGPALGELVSEGVLYDDEDRVLARFRQRFRAWLGRPLLEMRIEIEPEHPPEGYPWHAYYGARFAWRDERSLLLRGVNGIGSVTSHTRPETPDYLELRLGNQRTTLFPGGLPFHQRHGGRMLDVILMPEGEKTRTFDLAIGLDREYPMQTALGLATPVPVVSVDRGPPHIGATGWLFHLDAPNLSLLSLRPAAEGADAVVARLLETAGQMNQAGWRCVRDPKRAILTDARGQTISEPTVEGDTVQLEVASGDLMQLRIEFS